MIGTGRRLNYPLPDCHIRPSDCDDLEVVNTFDGWGLEQQVSIPFTGNVDPQTVSSDSVFLIGLSSELRGNSPTDALIGINQIVWDPATQTAYAEVDKQLEQHHRYALIVTDAVRDSHGRKVKATREFKTLDGVPRWYANRLEEAFDVVADLAIAERHFIP